MQHMDLDDAFKEEEHPFRIAIVCAMWLTGFDVRSLSTLYLEPKEAISAKDLMALYEDYYANERFVQICAASPHLKHVARTNYCHIFPTVVKNRVVIFSAIDNLVKGASGQAIQNMNILFGLDESLGLV